jgi:hypothetical protein
VRAHLPELRPCIAEEYGRNGRLLTVRFVLGIASDGSVVTATTAPATPQFQTCVQEKFRTIRFPTLRDRRQIVNVILTIREALAEVAATPAEGQPPAVAPAPNAPRR